MYKLVDPTILIRQREEKAQAALDKVNKKAANAAAAEAKRLAILEKGRIPPREMFKPPNVSDGTWSEWDEQGLPIKDGEGKEVSKGTSKRVLKEWKGQEKAHLEFLAWEREKSG